MANLTEVQMAFKQGDKAKAAKLLKTVLQERPSADAWVMAARLTSNPETAKMHLQRALAFDSKHVKARDMLRDLGGTPMSTSAALTGGLLPAIRMELEKFGANKPVLRNLSPGQRMIMAISLYVVIGAFMVMMLSSLFSTPVVPPAPAITVMPVFQGDTLISQWTTEGLNISNVQNVTQAPNELSKETLNFTVTDEVGAHNVTVFLYDSTAGIVNDGVRLTSFTTDDKNKLEILQTAVIAYPADMNEATVTLLVKAFNATPTASA
jgi:hypothetical protein